MEFATWLNAADNVIVPDVLRKRMIEPHSARNVRFAPIADIRELGAGWTGPAGPVERTI